MTPPKILIIDDNPDFGGHQVMTAYGIEGLLQFGQWQVLAMLHPDNQQNRNRWSAVTGAIQTGRLRILEAPTRTARFQALRCYYQRSALRRLLQQVKAFDPDLILVIQGNIEQGCSAFRLKGRVACPIISYIPVPHKHAEMGAKLGALRDLTCRRLYAQPDGFITISETLAGMLRQYGARGRIQVVENGIPLEPFKHVPDKAAARAQLNLPANAFIWGQIGRTEFKQKGQDFALNLFLQRARSVPTEHLVFLGSGPDSFALTTAAAAHRQVDCLPWTDQPAPFYAAIDALLLPSRYEGVPLAMLEALANAVPVAATDRDGMRDWLPESWRFRYRDAASGLKALNAVRHADTAHVQALKSRVWESHSLDAFSRAFNSALEAWQ